MPQLTKLAIGDTVEIIAPASRCSDKDLAELQQLLQSWQLKCIISEDLFGTDLLCANTDEMRFNILKQALFNPQSKAVICARGGYGCARIISELNALTPPVSQKLFIGMSDVTVLNTFLQQKWQWPVLHGALAPSRFSPQSIAAVKSIMFGEVDQVQFNGIPLNAAAEKNALINADITGGNLCILQSGIGTFWEVDSRNKILFLEEVGERGYRVDRMLEHLRQAGIFNQAAAILLGDFIQGDEPDGSSLINPVLERFAKTCDVPVVKVEGIGHDRINFPLPLGTKAKLCLGNRINLVCSVL